MDDERLVLLKSLVGLASDALDAATTLDTVRLNRLISEKADQLFALQVALQEAPPTESKLITALRAEATTLRTLEKRLAVVSEGALSTFRAVMPSTQPATYGRAGLLRG